MEIRQPYLTCPSHFPSRVPPSLLLTIDVFLLSSLPFNGYSPGPHHPSHTSQWQLLNQWLSSRSLPICCFSILHIAARLTSKTQICHAILLPKHFCVCFTACKIVYFPPVNTGSLLFAQSWMFFPSLPCSCHIFIIQVFFKVHILPSHL